VLPAGTLCDAAEAGIWNHGCTQMNTDRTKYKNEDTRTRGLMDFCSRFAELFITKRNP
jgi:hypothetical protein